MVYPFHAPAFDGFERLKGQSARGPKYAIQSPRDRDKIFSAYGK